MNIDRLIEIVREAGALMNTESYEVHQKGGCVNIVTSVDVAVQELLRKRLIEELPESGFVCEEEDTHDIKHDYIWIIDPIDGTANFSRGIRECAVSVGLLDHGVRRMGVVYVPRTGEMFSAAAGEGAYLNGKRIHVSERTFEDSVMCTSLPVYYKEYTDVCGRIIADAFKECNDLRRFGAAAPEICYVALGIVDLYFEWRLGPWDYAGAALILQEAGGCLCDLDGDTPDPLKHSSILAANNPSNLHRLLSIAHRHTK